MNPTVISVGGMQCTRNGYGFRYVKSPNGCWHLYSAHGEFLGEFQDLSAIQREINRLAGIWHRQRGVGE